MVSDKQNAELPTVESKPSAPPVVSYKTFRTFLDGLRVTMPDQIDRSIMHSYSGGVQSQLVHAVKSLHLVNQQNAPTETLRDLVNAEAADRQTHLAAVLRSSYPFLFDGKFSLKSATGRQLIDAFTSTGITGDTVRKAIAFFLAAAKDAGIPLSPYFKKLKLRSLQNGGRRAARPDDDETQVDTGNNDDEPIPEKPSAGESLMIELKSGGTLTVSASTSFFKMSPTDRAFVFEIIDRLQKYGAEDKP
jgi:hypothetical protein